MDRISCLAFLLYQVENKEIQKAALQLVSGEVSITELKNIPDYLSYIQDAEKELKKHTLNNNDVCHFVESHLYIYE